MKSLNKLYFSSSVIFYYILLINLASSKIINHPHPTPLHPRPPTNEIGSFDTNPSPQNASFGQIDISVCRDFDLSLKCPEDGRESRCCGCKGIDMRRPCTKDTRDCCSCRGIDTSRDCDSKNPLDNCCGCRGIDISRDCDSKNPLDNCCGCKGIDRSRECDAKNPLDNCCGCKGIDRSRECDAKNPLDNCCGCKGIDRSRECDAKNPLDNCCGCKGIDRSRECDAKNPLDNCCGCRGLDTSRECDIRNPLDNCCTPPPTDQSPGCNLRQPYRLCPSVRDPKCDASNYIPDTCWCNVYYQCDPNTRTVTPFVCPDPLQVDPRATVVNRNALSRLDFALCSTAPQSCPRPTFKSVVRLRPCGCDPSCAIPPTCPPFSGVTECTGSVYLPHRCDCQFFWVCSPERIPTLQVCAPGQFFEPSGTYGGECKSAGGNNEATACVPRLRKFPLISDPKLPIDNQVLPVAPEPIPARHPMADYILAIYKDQVPPHLQHYLHAKF